MDADFLLSTRYCDRGGRERPTIHEEIRPTGGGTWLVFIHGYNVDRKRAVQQWRTLRSLLTREGTAGLQAGILLWPGDLYRWRASSRWVYPRAIPRAEHAGRLLGDYLTRRGQQDAVLVGHSLGALVALEAANRVRGDRPLRAFALLGPAVSVDKLAATGSFGYRPLAAREGVLFSAKDPVLRAVFRTGERLAAPFVAGQAAVGLNGEPSERGWHAVDCAIDHHEYWRVVESAHLVDWMVAGTSAGTSGRPGGSLGRSPVERLPFI
jgi:pimeloyl-ACP methyl ester carboxylesterase